MLSRGEDGKLVVMVDGREELVFRNIEDIAIDWGLTTSEDNFVGRNSATTSEMNGPAKLTIKIKPDSPGFGRLIELRRQRAGSLETRSSIKFDITCAVNFGDAGRERWRFPDVKLEAGSTNVPGRNQHVNATITAICDEPSRMA